MATFVSNQFNSPHLVWDKEKTGGVEEEGAGRGGGG